ncbi:ubiquitin interaction motif protein [Aspergillus nomiae NRRL 13137]|uniref:Ubiquitin interaction motif protein n=1 Tax=Aspergillus nomiae NRRL (strain ATCC 15546 / NRRL 13137 / CBS 260.88 / M93) TaxID=1509407 RepID=A0A0L1JCA0_ASPN3|nr:ubiquitin interaction motif protein [Aspergillus nomiae NRRL 13137]KNG89401.1 ubiquitin interaction motif protein [Aspergillus nomiae NRRL 13137]
MASEPTEEAIANFVSFTSTSREQAISFLKANDLNSNKAINAYFEDPTGDPAAFADATDPNKGLSLAEQEERELQQAVAMSLNQNLGQQETGVTTSNKSNFGRATRDFYDEGAWAMTLFNSSAREIIISPNPGDRKRVEGEPAFLRPSEDSLYLGGLLTILNSIPLAREALLQRNRILSNYGHDPQWWNGQPINLPKIVTIQDAHDGDTDWDDIIYETQRLIAFLDITQRSFGSVDALVSLKSMSTYDSEGSIGRFLETWQDAAVRADPGNQLATVFSSKAYKRPLTVYDTPIHKDFFILESFVDPEHGQTLYDVLDRAIWSDRPGEELDDVWLEHIGEIFTIRLESTDSTKPVDVKIPAVFYPDRYLADSRDFSRDFRAQRLQEYDGISKLESLIDRFSASKSAMHSRGMTLKETLEKAASAVSVTLPKSLANGANGLSLSPEAANAEAKRLADELREVSSKIDDKLKAADEWQWWRISFSTDDAKARQVESQQGDAPSSKNADVIGYTARKVREIEVLKAAREESKNVLLVYANGNAMNFREEPIPSPLQEFVNADNAIFDAEFKEQERAEDASDRQNEDSNSASRQDESTEMNELAKDDQRETTSAAANTMGLENEAIAGATIELLESRLRRLTYLLTGDANWTGVPTAPAKPASLDDSVSRRLLSLERELERLSRNIPAVRDVLLLHDRFPDLFRPTPPQTFPENLSTQNLASIVLSYASAFPETASRLTSLNDLPIPDTQTSAALIQLQPRLDQLAQVQEEQAKQISELRVRTARALQRWYEIALVGGGECWAEWEGRLEDVEREVKREEVVRERRAKEL